MFKKIKRKTLNTQQNNIIIDNKNHHKIQNQPDEFKMIFF